MYNPRSPPRQPPRYMNRVAESFLLNFAVSTAFVCTLAFGVAVYAPLAYSYSVFQSEVQRNKWEDKPALVLDREEDDRTNTPVNRFPLRL